jgi:hypothetical protein
MKYVAQQFFSIIAFPAVAEEAMTAELDAQDNSALTHRSRPW